MTRPAPVFEVRLAACDEEIIAAQRLRYEVFVEELGGTGAMVDHENRLERDEFDPYFDHLLLIDHARGKGEVVGVYRLLRGDQAEKLGRFYSDSEYDLSALRASGRRLLELGRSCVHPDYRGGTGLMLLWNGLSRYVAEHGIEILFGVASFHGTDIEALKGPLSLLYHRHLAPEELRVRPLAGACQPMNLLAEEDIDRAAAIKATPALIKAYLRVGGFVGDGAFIDHAFNTTDVFLILDTAKMSEKHRALYARGQRG